MSQGHIRWILVGSSWRKWIFVLDTDSLLDRTGLVVGESCSVVGGEYIGYRGGYGEFFARDKTFFSASSSFGMKVGVLDMHMVGLIQGWS